MHLKEINYSNELNEFFTRCSQLGVVLDICILDFDEAHHDFGISPQIAVEGMKIFAQRYLERLIAMNPGRDVSKYFQIKIDENVAPKSEKIDYKDFLGEGFDFENNTVSLFHYSEGAKSSCIFDGFVHALLDPPYSIRLLPRETKLSVESGLEEQKRMTEFLFEFLDKLLQIKDFADFTNYEIYSWSDDWSNYFNAGKEWWGTFYWTFLNRQNRTVTIIAASQTD